MSEQTRWCNGRIPATHLDLFDYFAWRFGAVDNEDPNCPPWKFRGIEANKIKRTIAKRGLTPLQMFQTGEYCHRNGIPIQHWSWAFKHVPAAKREVAQRALAARSMDLEQAIESAIASERSFMDHDSFDWVRALVTSQGEYRKEVYERWVKQRQPMLSAV